MCKLAVWKLWSWSLIIFKNVIFLLKSTRLIVMLSLDYLGTMNLELRNVLLEHEIGMIQFIHAGD